MDLRLVKRYSEATGTAEEEIIEHYDVYSATYVFAAIQLRVHFEDFLKSLMFWRKKK